MLLRAAQIFTFFLITQTVPAEPLLKVRQVVRAYQHFGVEKVLRVRREARIGTVSAGPQQRRRRLHHRRAAIRGAALVRQMIFRFDGEATEWHQMRLNRSQFDDFVHTNNSRTKSQALNKFLICLN